MLSIIVAVSENGVIGRDGDLPWHLSADLKRFKQLTMGHTIVMGRKTWDSIGRPLPGRTSVVITRQEDFCTEFEDVKIAPSIDKALSNIEKNEEVFIIGGASIYELALPKADRLHITRVHAEVEGDTHFPKVDWNDWKLVEESRHASDQRNDHEYSFYVYERVS